MDSNDSDNTTSTCNSNKKIPSTTDNAKSTAMMSSVDQKDPSLSKTITRSDNNEKPIKEKSPTKFGKANPIRDVILLVSILGILTFLTSGYGNPKVVTETSEIDPLTQLTDMVKNLARDAASKRRKEPCSIFLHTGSIPNTGLSYIAGRNYTVGETLSIKYQEQTYPVGDDGLRATTAAFVLKHHPIEFNVQGILYYETNSTRNDPSDNNNNIIQLRVTKPITVGDEFFVEYDPKLHNHSIFNHIPTDSDYKTARDITMDALRSVSDQEERNGRVICRMVPVMRFVKQTVSRFHPTISNLLPDTQFKANLFRTKTPSTAILKKHLLMNLQQFAICLDDVEQHQQTPQPKDHDGITTETGPFPDVVVVQRQIRKGEVVTTLPLYMMSMAPTKSNDETCNLEQQECPIAATKYQQQRHNCFTNDNLPSVLLCPLGPSIERELSTKSSDISANVEYRWSTHRAVQKFVMYDLYRYSASVTAWDVIALRDLSIGEKLIVHKIPTDIPDKIKSFHNA